MKYDHASPWSIFSYARTMIGKSLRDVLTARIIMHLEKDFDVSGRGRKGHFGDLVEEYVFGKKPDNRSEPDFPKAGVELKTTPLRTHPSKRFVSKERLVFSMIDYKSIDEETWEESSFLKKNRRLLLMFYLYEPNVSKLDYKFKIVRLLDLLEELAEADLIQIKADWRKIVDKVRAGEAHLLSEASTAYLGAATKAANSSVLREQPRSDEPAKPRAFSFKQSYLNQLIQESLLGDVGESIFKPEDKPQTIEDVVSEKFSAFRGLVDEDIAERFGVEMAKRPKNYRRLLVNRMLGVNSNKIKELERANITLRVIALEPSGRLVESVSFPSFEYQCIVRQEWEESDFYEQLTTKRFLFAVFRKTSDGMAVFEGHKFWHFPIEDIEQAKWVWEETVRLILGKKADALPGIRDNPVAHVRPHAKNAQDVLPTGYGTYEVKKSFWLNAKYIEQQLC